MGSDQQQTNNSDKKINNINNKDNTNTNNNNNNSNRNNKIKMRRLLHLALNNSVDLPITSETEISSSCFLNLPMMEYFEESGEEERSGELGYQDTIMMFVYPVIAAFNLVLIFGFYRACRPWSRTNKLFICLSALDTFRFVKS